MPKMTMVVEDGRPEPEPIEVRWEIKGSDHIYYRVGIPVEDRWEADDTVFLDDRPEPESKEEIWEAADLYGLVHFGDRTLPFAMNRKVDNYQLVVGNPDAVIVVDPDGLKRHSLPEYLEQFVGFPIIYNDKEIGVMYQSNELLGYESDRFMNRLNAYVGEADGDVLMVKFGGFTHSESRDHQRLVGVWDDAGRNVGREYVKAFRAWVKRGRPEGRKPVMRPTTTLPMANKEASA